MIRTLAPIARRPDLSREAFRRHYEQVHVPLALPLLAGIAHYVRNHVIASLSGPEPGFDVLSEFGYGDPVALERVVSDLASERGDPIRRDEARFMDRDRNSFFLIAPRNLTTARREPPAEAIKVALLAARTESAERGAFLDELARAVGVLAAGAAAHAHFETQRVDERPLCDAVTFLWYDRARYDEAALRGWRAAASRITALRVQEDATLRAADWFTPGR